MERQNALLFLGIFIISLAAPAFSQSITPQIEQQLTAGNLDSVYVLLKAAPKETEISPGKILLDRIRMIINCDCSWQPKRPRSYSEEEIDKFSDWATDLRIRYPKNSYVLFISATASLLSRDESTALQYLNQSIDLNDKNVASLDIRGRIRGMHGDFQRAIDDFTAALKVDSLDSYAYSGRGDAFLGFSRNKAAIADLNRAISLGYDDPINFHNRANAYKDTGEHALALVDYTEVIRRDSTFSMAYFSQGSIYQAYKLSFLAYYDYEKFLRYMTPAVAGSIPSENISGIRTFVETVTASMHKFDKELSNVDYWLGEASVCTSDSEWTCAMGNILRAMELDSTRYEPYSLRGYIFDELGHPHRAMVDLNKAVAMAPHEALVYRIRAESYINRFIKSKNSEVPEYGEKQAIADFNRALTIQPDDIETHYSRALIYDLIADTVKAKSDFEFVIKNATPADSFKVRISQEYLDGYTQ